MIFSFLLFFFVHCAFAILAVPDLPDKGVTDADNNFNIDPNVDYTKFRGRVTDRNKKGDVLKVKVENNNIKFFKAGDQVFFRINNQHSKIPCRASIKAVEDFYFVMSVFDWRYCWDKSKYFPRGMQLNFESQLLSKRVYEASQFRKILILKKEGFLKQLNQVNNFLWNYEQKKMQLAAEYDKKINEVKEQKRLALDNLLQNKQEQILLQTELRKRLDQLDTSMKYYQVERQEYLLDRWDMDKDTRIEMGQRPLELKRP